MADKACPFCGSNELVPHFSTDLPNQSVCVSCEDCDADGPSVTIDPEDRATSIETAGDLWNARKRDKRSIELEVALSDIAKEMRFPSEGDSVQSYTGNIIGILKRAGFWA